MRVYLDTSALLKRVFSERDSPILIETVRAHHDAGDALVSSALAWIEVSRAVRRLPPVVDDVGGITEAALAGVMEHPIAAEVVALARRLDPPVMRSLDAIHLASALVLDVDLMLTYDQRLADAASTHHIATAAPSLSP